MDIPFWQLILAGFIGSMLGRFLFRLRKRRTQSNMRQDEDQE